MIQLASLLAVLSTAVCVPINITSSLTEHKSLFIHFDNITCSVKDGILYINGENRGKLNESDEAALERYFGESTNWASDAEETLIAEIEGMFKDLFEYQKVFWSSIFGLQKGNQASSNEAEVIIGNSTEVGEFSVEKKLEFPDPPEFCLH